MANKTLYIIDGHAQIYRAYYAPFGALTSPKGEPTRAVHVFTQMVLNLLRDKRPDYLAVAMDVADETVFRGKIDPNYKANRDAMPEDLPPQIDRIVSILDAMRIPILRMQGFEADDIMATLARKFGCPDCHVILVSRDKDLDQLLGEHVRMYDPMKDREIDTAVLKAEKGYGPELAVEAQMLIGDSTDNIVGVTGVGPKKAAELLGKYGSVAAIIENADKLTPKLKENVLAFRERMDVVRQLVTLRYDVPVEFELATAEVGRFAPVAASTILEELGLKKLIERLAGEAQKASGEPKAPVTPPQVSPETKESCEPPPGFLFGHDAELIPVGPGARAETGAPLRGASRPEKYTTVDTDEALRELAGNLRQSKGFAFDTETCGTSTELALRPAYADLVGISLSHEPKTGYYIPVRGIGRTIGIEAVKKHLGPILADAQIPKCAQNAKFDVVVLRSNGMDVTGVTFDPMLASFTLNSLRRSHGIDALALDLLNFKKIATTELIGTGKNQVQFDQISIERTSEYACEDADIALRLQQNLAPRLEKEVELSRLFNDLEMPLLEVLAAMELRGVAIDKALLTGIGSQMAERMKDLEREIHRHAGREFNLNSTQQLAEVLFDDRKLPVIKRTKTLRSTDAEVLERLAAETEDPIPKLLLEFRELSKLKGTYVDALPLMIHSRTGRIHPSFSQTGAVTGRLSCSEPNLQNIPIRTEVGAQIRKAFVPGQKDWVLIKADYSQIELRVLAHFCGDAALTAAFKEDRDIHAFVASQIHAVALDQVTSQQRSQAKTVNFGIIYGQSAFGLARQTGMSQTDARVFIEKYFARYPKIRGFLDECIAHARKHGHVKTMLGRRRAIPDIDSRNQTARNAAERLAVNTVVQGTAADMIKRAMVNIHRRIEKENRPARMLIQVHDELVFECPAAVSEAESKMIAEEMSRAIPLSVPVKVDVGCGANWLEAK